MNKFSQAGCAAALGVSSAILAGYFTPISLALCAFAVVRSLQPVRVAVLTGAGALVAYIAVSVAVNEGLPIYIVRTLTRFVLSMVGSITNNL